MNNEKKVVVLRLDEDVYGKLKFVSEAEQRSINKQVKIWVIRCIKHFESKYGEIWL